MAKLKMQKIALAASMLDSKQIIDALLRFGAIELTDMQEIHGFYKLDTDASVMQVEKYIGIAENAKKILCSYVSYKSSLMSSFSARKEMTSADFVKLSDKTDKTLGLCINLNKREKEIAENNAAIIRAKTQIAALEPWRGLDIPFANNGTRYTDFIIGSFPSQMSTQDIAAHLSAQLPQIEEYEIECVSQRDDQTCVAVMCLKSDMPELEASLRAIGFSRASVEFLSLAGKKIESLEAEVKKAEEAIATLTDKIKEKGDKLDDINFLLDYLIVRRDKNTALSKVLMNSRMFVLEGFIPISAVKPLTSYLEANYDVAFDIFEPEEEEDTPVVLKNGPFSKPVESVTEMYSLPNKDDIDPTPYMSFFYYFFFGMMLSDAGYGLLIALATGAMLLFVKLEEKTKNSMKMFFMCGLSTVMWGSLYGSWFGDIPHTIAYQFFDKDILNTSQIALWMDPLERLMDMLVWCFIFGLAHLFFGTVVKGGILLRRKEYKEAFCETIPTFVAVLGIAPTFFGMFTEIPQSIKAVGKYLLIIGCILVIATAGRSSKSILAKFFNGLYGLYNLFSGYLGDVLSYSRLLALGLSTGVVASVINMLGTLPASKPIKAVLLIVVFPLGHLVNLAINVLGAYVHANRLQFVEFFGKFYEGGGRAFTPLKANTKTYRFKEEIKHG